MPNVSSKPYLVGLVATLMIAVVAWAVMRSPDTPTGSNDVGYAAQVTISGAKVSEGESMMAGGVVYYNGVIENRGDKTLTGYTADLTFDDVYGKPLETDRRVLLGTKVRPIPPHANREFEIGFDRVPEGWNQAPPTPVAAAVYVH